MSTNVGRPITQGRALAPGRALPSGRSLAPTGRAVAPGRTLSPNQANDLSRYATGSAGSGGLLALMAAFGTPINVIGSVTRGDFRNALTNLVTLSQRGQRQGLGGNLQQWRVLPNSGWGTAAALGVDILADPTTYVTFGAGAVRTPALLAARQAADQANIAAARSGNLMTLSERARRSLDIGDIEAAAPRELQVRFMGRRIGGVRAGSPTLDAGEAAARVSRVPGLTGLREMVTRLAHSGAGTNQVMRRTANDLRRLAEVAEKDVADMVGRLTKDALRIERQIGREALSSDLFTLTRRGDVMELLARNREMPSRYPIPQQLQPVADDLGRLLDEADELEAAAGIIKNRDIVRGYAERYLPHMVAGGPASRAAYRRFTGKEAPASAANNPFFIQKRTAPDVERLIAEGAREGFKVEMNYGRLVQSRVNASIRARTVKALQDAVGEKYGIKRAPLEMPDVAQYEELLDAENALLRQLMQRADDTDASAASAAARDELVQANAALRAAQRTGDMAGVRAAQERIRRLNREEAIGGIVTPPVQRRADAARRSLDATGATYGVTRGTGADRVVVATNAARRRAPTRARNVSARAEQAAAAIRAKHAETMRKGAHAARAAALTAARARNPGATTDELLTVVSNGRRRRKRLREFEDDFRRVLDERYESGTLSPALREMYEDLLRADALDAMVARLREAVARGDGGLLEGADLPLAQVLDEVIDQMEKLGVRSGQRRGVRAAERRAAAEQVGEVPRAAQPVTRTMRGQRNMALYFTADGAELREAAEMATDAATKAVERQNRRTQARLAAAERALEAAKKRKGSPEVIKAAEKRVREARAADRAAFGALSARRATFEGNPVAIRAQTRRAVTAKKQLTAAQRKAGKTERLNEELAARSGRPVDKDTYNEARRTWEQLPQAGKYHKGVLVPKAVKDNLDRAYSIITPQVKNENAVRVVGDIAAAVTSRWKALALLSPGYHTRNMMDDGLRAALAGATSPAKFVRAARILAGRGGWTINGVRYSAEEVQLLAKNEGIIGIGFTPQEIGSSLDSSSTRRIREPGRGRVARGSAWASQYREDTTRLWLWLSRIDKGDTMSEAADVTRWFLFDYGEVGEFVNAARRFWLPFVTYMSKAIPQAVKLSLMRPGIPATMDKIYSTMDEQVGLDRGILPEWFDAALPIPDWGGPLDIISPSNILGTPEGTPALIDPKPMMGLVSPMYLQPSVSNAARTFGEFANPAFVTGMAAAPVPGFDFFRMREVREGSTVWAPWLIQKAAELGLPIPGYTMKEDQTNGGYWPAWSARASHVMNALPIFGQTSRVVPNDRSAAQNAPRGPVVRYFSGVPIYTLDQARNAYWAERFGR